MGADATDERFSTLRGRKLHEDDLEAMVGGWMGGIDVETIETLLQSDNIPAHVVADSRDISADRQLRHRRHFMRLPHDLGGDSVVEASRFRLSDTPVDPVRAAPTFGRDADYVLGTILSYSSKRIEALRSDDILA
jgi:crotonobetainyl-CoA:carnitine CoA-transferase CaiB-like acyl-CoA transferase